MKKAYINRTILGITFLVSIISFTGCQDETVINPRQNSSESTQETTGNKPMSETPTSPQDGLVYQKVRINPNTENEKTLIAVVIDPKKFHFQIQQNADYKNARSIEQVHQDNNSVVTFNGSFFDEDFKAMGLLITQSQQLHKQEKSSLMNGIFSIKNEKASLDYAPEYSQEPTTEFAIQNGPILIDEKSIIQVKTDSGKQAGRTAIGITKDRKIIVIALQISLLQSNNTLSLYEFAHLLKEADAFKNMGIHSVLNLDGGTSTGLKVANFYLPEYVPVQNIILVKPR